MKVTQSSLPPLLFGSLLCQLRKLATVPSVQVHVPSLAASVRPIKVSFIRPSSCANASAFAAALWMLARSPPKLWQLARAVAKSAGPKKKVNWVGCGGNGGGSGAAPGG